MLENQSENEILKLYLNNVKYEVSMNTFLDMKCIAFKVSILNAVLFSLDNVTRNEKFLASLAAGKWVLHKSYFEACRQEQRFVEVHVDFRS